MIDGSNISRDGPGERPNIDNAISAHRKLPERHGVSEAYVAVGPGQLYEVRKNPQDHDLLVGYFSGPLRKYPVESPGGLPDDQMMIRIALETDLDTLTNDRFRDLTAVHPEIAKKIEPKLFKYKIVAGQPIVPDLGCFKKP